MFTSEIHHRRSIRLKDYDYGQPGAYFITICTQGRQCLFGSIADSKISLSQSGQMVHTEWNKIPAHYSGIYVDAFQIMPNHIHGIIIVGAPPCGCPNPCACPDVNASKGQPQGVAPTNGLSLPDVVHRFKTLTTKKYTDGVKQNGWSPFAGKLWQRNYYEHVIRNDDDLNDIRKYIANNPLRWADDPDYIN